MLAMDPLSLVFIGCAAFSAAFLLIATLTGAGHGHMLHLGAHAAHIGHMAHLGHASAGHVGQAAHAAHATHVAHTGTSGSALHSARATLTGILDQMVNLYGILIFLLIFGVLGYLLHNFGALPVIVTLLLALVVGLICSGAASLLLARLFLLYVPRTLTRDSSRLAGRLGQISMTVRTGGIGEVIYQGETGGRHSVGARSSDGEPIAAGTEVVILDYEDGIALVEPWDRFLANARAGEEPRIAPVDQPQ
jgi:membrane protein implicated in regulation of membrane protease activity